MTLFLCALYSQIPNTVQYLTNENDMVGNNKEAAVCRAVLFLVSILPAQFSEL